jgi:uncharacterized protein (TIGR00296 family)
MSEPTVRKLTLLDLQGIDSQTQAVIQKIAARIVVAKVLKERLSASVFDELGELAEHYVYGCFTTLKRGKTLRGSCGFLGRPTRLRDAIAESAQKTARDDPRMPGISSIELPYLSCHLTLLSDPMAIEADGAQRNEKIELGKHGLRITTSLTSPYGQRGGLILPGQPLEQGWDTDATLGALCRQAGLPADAWKDPSVLLETFEGLEIPGNLNTIELPDPMPLEGPPGDVESLQKLKAATVQTMINLSHGATPNYYVLDAMDGTAQTIVLSAVDVNSNVPLAHWIQTSLRPGLPLQSTVFELSRLAEGTLRRSRFDKAVDVNEGEKKGNVEKWMLEIEAVMKRSLKGICKDSLAAYLTVARTSWVRQWPGQIVLAVNSTHWTTEVELAIKEYGKEGLEAYKDLCEIRIRELDPTHQIPIS